MKISQKMENPIKKISLPKIRKFHMNKSFLDFNFTLDETSLIEIGPYIKKIANMAEGPLKCFFLGCK